MIELLNAFFNANLLSTIGLLIIITFLGSKIFQRLGVPQVVGFIVIGMLHGSSFLRAVPPELVDQLTFVSEIALGLIGYDIGSHLKFKDLRNLGKSILVILVFEALGTFVLVTIGVYALTQSSAAALIFGALSSATAPAATVDVLAEYDARGPLTTSLLAVVGLDDALALILYSVAAALAEALLIGSEFPSVVQILEFPILELSGSLILGIVIGLALDFILQRMEKSHDGMAVSIASVLLAVGISETMGFSLILTTMIMGFVVINREAEHGQHIRHTIEQTGPVIYVLFFALIGARFQVDLLPTMGLLGIAYVLMRSFGKFAGAWIGGRIGGAEPVVRKNLGFGLLSQAGVAIGLAIASASRFSALGAAGRALGVLIINVITATTFVVQIIGPIFVKFAISRAGEIGMAKATADDWITESTPD